MSIRTATELYRVKVQSRLNPECQFSLIGDYGPFYTVCVRSRTLLEKVSSEDGAIPDCVKDP